ncbi:MAG: nitrogen regulation protein NR(II) [Gammaproteobacteria bacterium]|nr:nitrogen regulation protein NR(II) [Gammaproteobacteria bacterium]
MAGRNSRSVGQPIGCDSGSQLYHTTDLGPAEQRRPRATLDTSSNDRINSDALLANITTGILLVASDDSIIYLNAAAEALLGISARLAKGQCIQRVRPGIEELHALLIRARDANVGHSREIKLWSPDQESQDVTVRVTLNDKPAGSLLIELSDATYRHQLDREVNLMNQHGVSRQIISQLAHEIRNPLGGLRGAAQLLERELPTAELKEFTGIIIREADRLAGLMNNLLGPIKPPRKDPINVHEVLEHVAVLIENEAHDHDLSLVRDYDPSLPDLLLDRDQMIQAILNIARNAMQSLDRGGELIIRTRALTNVMLGKERKKIIASIEIEDNGHGVPDDIRDSLFFPLVSGRSGGSGLGLPLAQDLVSRHNGLIEFTSQPGRTVFMLRLPLEEY